MSSWLNISLWIVTSIYIHSNLIGLTCAFIVIDCNLKNQISYLQTAFQEYLRFTNSFRQIPQNGSKTKKECPLCRIISDVNVDPLRMYETNSILLIVDLDLYAPKNNNYWQLGLAKSKLHDIRDPFSLPITNLSFLCSTIQAASA